MVVCSVGEVTVPNAEHVFEAGRFGLALLAEELVERLLGIELEEGPAGNPQHVGVGKEPFCGGRWRAVPDLKISGQTVQVTKRMKHNNRFAERIRRELRGPYLACRRQRVLVERWVLIGHRDERHQHDGEDAPEMARHESLQVGSCSYGKTALRP